MNIGDQCPSCKQADVIYVTAYEPWSAAHLACPSCNSTFVLPKYITVDLFGGTALRTTVDNMETLTRALAQCLYFDFDDGQWKGDIAVKSKTYE